MVSAMNKQITAKDAIALSELSIAEIQKILDAQKQNIESGKMTIAKTVILQTIASDLERIARHARLKLIITWLNSLELP